MAFNTWESLLSSVTTTGNNIYRGSLIRVGASPVHLTGVRLRVGSAGDSGEFHINKVVGTGSGKNVDALIHASSGVIQAVSVAGVPFIEDMSMSITLDANTEYLITYHTVSGSWYYAAQSATRNTGEVSFIPYADDNTYLESVAFPSVGANLGSANIYQAYSLYYTTPNTPPNPPSGLSVSDVGSGTPRLSWVFNDTDAGDTQSAWNAEVEVWNGSAWVLYYSAGQASTNQYMDIPLTHKFAANTQYRFRVKTADQAGAYSAFSADYTWTTSKAYLPSGSYTSEVLNLGRTGAVNAGTLTYNAVVPADTTLQAQYSVNGGAWTNVANGGSVPSGNTVQIRFNFTSSYGLATAELLDWTLTYPQEYYASGEWISPVIDTGVVVEGYKLVHSRVWTATGGGGSVSYRISSDGVAWGAWLSAGINVDLTWGRFVQLRYYSTPSADRRTTSLLNTWYFTAYTAYDDTGIWETPPIDIRNVDASALVAWAASANVTISFSYTEDGQVWSAWEPMAASGSSPSVDLSVVKFIKVKADLTRIGASETSSLDSMTVTVNPSARRGFWVSEVADVSQALDRTTGKTASDTVMGTDVLVTRYSYSTDGGVTFSAWDNILADGSLPTPAGTTHVKLMHIVIGQLAEIRSTTLFFDGQPAAALLLSGMTANSEYDFTQLRDKLIIVNGSDAPRKWDDVGVNLLGGSPPVFKFVETHLNKVWGVERDNPSRVRWSETLNPESWPALNFIDLNPEDGAEITALHKAGSYIMAGKSNSVALVTGDRDSNFSVMWLDSHERGPVGFRSAATLDKFITYIGTDGVRISDLTKSVVNSQKLLLTWENEINHRRLNQAAVMYWDHYLLIALPSADSLYNDTVWVLDTLRNAWSRIVGWNVSCWLAFKQYGSDILLAGDSQTGQVYQVFIGDRDDDQLVEIDWQSGNIDLDYPERLKLFGNNTITVEGKSEERRLVVQYVVVGGTTPDGEIIDYEQTFAVDEIVIPAGKGQTHIYRILPPLWGAVLGRALSVKLISGVDIHSITIDMTVKGIVPGGL